MTARLTAVRIARIRQAAAQAALADAYGRQPVVYLIHFDRLYVPYPGAPQRDCTGHYVGKPESSRILKVQFAAVDRELAEHPVVSALVGPGWTG